MKNKDSVSRYVIIFFVVIGLPVVLIIEGLTQKHWVFANESFHASVEIFGAFAALLMGYFLILAQNEKNELDSIGPALGFIGMGIFDGFHSFSLPGQGFVFLHSFAVLLGGIGFSLVWLPKGKLAFLKDGKAIWSFITVSIIIGFIGLLKQDWLPLMIINDKFTFGATLLNMLSGIFFIIGGIKFFIIYLKGYEFQSFLLLIMAILFSIGGFTFNFSLLWDDTWWFWHILRLVAFGIALWAVMRAYAISQNQIKENLIEINNINRKLMDYSYTISHDLKEPIRSIRTFSEFIREDYADQFDEEAKDYFERIIRASKKMAKMIDDILVLSRIGKTDIEFKSVNMDELLSDVKDTLRQRISETNTSVLVNKLPNIICQPVWIKTVFQNLVSNSIKYSDKPHTNITISCEEFGSFYEFSVKDNGKGIEEDQFDKIFGLFRKAHQDRNVEGSGAGLAIVSNVIEQHGGKIWVDWSKPGEGTIIKFTIKKQ